MQEKTLRDTLEEFHLKLLQLNPEHDGVKPDEAAELAKHIRALLDDPNLEQRETPIDELLQDSVAQFGLTHPRLSRMLDELMLMLSSIGI